MKKKNNFANSGNKERFIRELYNDSLWVNFFARIRFWTGSFSQLEEFIPKKGKVLDLGCGYGIFTNYLGLCSDSRIMIGIDIDRHKIAKANKGLRNVSFSVGDATKLKLKDLDGILLHDVLHHLNSYKQQEQLIRNCVLMLKHKGLLIIVEVDDKPLWKLGLGRLTDFLMYKGQRVYYRYKQEMLKFLQNYFSTQKIHLKTFRNNPFSQIVYICKKE